METLDSLKSGLASGRLAGATHLILSDQLTDFPVELFALAESLTFLNLSNNQLSQLPANFSKLKHLEIVFFNNNNFQQFPTVLAECPALSMISFKGNQIEEIVAEALSPTLRWLILTNNKIELLPDSIGQLPRLQKLMLAGNQLRALPGQLSQCHNLDLIRLSANQLQHLPTWLYKMPRLSWIAYSGNPFCQQADPAANDLPTVTSGEIALGEQLGQGASGVIYKAKWQNKDVAIKLFKGEITSDGSPLDEMKACIAAGSHPNLVNVLARYNSDGQTGLVFDFIPAGYRNLGGPPSLQSCTRDTYSVETTFTLQEIRQIAIDIASAVNHLHKRGIVHGDLYAHNILINQQVHSILGDFGAASFYELADERLARSLQQLESRAFGCLLEDLLDRCDDKKHPTFSKMCLLQQRCMTHEPEKRPCFQAISDELLS